MTDRIILYIEDMVTAAGKVVYRRNGKSSVGRHMLRTDHRPQPMTPFQCQKENMESVDSQDTNRSTAVPRQGYDGRIFLRLVRSFGRKSTKIRNIFVDFKKSKEILCNGTECKRTK